MGDVKFSPMENRVLRTLAGRKMTIADLTREIYRGRTRPLNPNNTIAGYVRRIQIKCKYNKLRWTVEGQGCGRGGRTVWITKL